MKYQFEILEKLRNEYKNKRLLIVQHKGIGKTQMLKDLEKFNQFWNIVNNRGAR